VRIIPDVKQIIVDTVNSCRRDFTYVLTTGGIGPTHDDITADAVAKAFGVELTQKSIGDAEYRVREGGIHLPESLQTPVDAGLVSLNINGSARPGAPRNAAGQILSLDWVTSELAQINFRSAIDGGPVLIPGSRPGWLFQRLAASAMPSLSSSRPGCGPNLRPSRQLREAHIQQLRRHLRGLCRRELQVPGGSF